jgi:hypothetical protein
VGLACAPVACNSTTDTGSEDGGSPTGAGGSKGGSSSSTGGKRTGTEDPDSGAPTGSGGAEDTDGGGGSTGSGGAEPAPDVGTEAGASAISCLQILQCVGDCGDTDQECADACVVLGSEDAQTKVIALSDCITTESCEDLECTQTNCADSLDACVSSSAPPAPDGKPLDGTPPKGSVPDELVGTWSRTNYGATDRLVLDADGTGSAFIGIAGGAGGCITVSSSTEEGNVVVTADLITIYATNVTNAEKDCSAPTVKTQGEPIVVDIAYRLQDPTTLITVRVDCANKYADDPSSIASYCRNELKKE